MAKGSDLKCKSELECDFDCAILANCLRECTVIGLSVSRVHGKFSTLNNKDSSCIKNEIICENKEKRRFPHPPGFT